MAFNSKHQKGSVVFRGLLSIIEDLRALRKREPANKEPETPFVKTQQYLQEVMAGWKGVVTLPMIVPGTESAEIWINKANFRERVVVVFQKGGKPIAFEKISEEEPLAEITRRWAKVA